MIEALLLLLTCQLAGELFSRAASLPIPGPVAGMALLFALLVWRGRRTKNPAVHEPPENVGRVADAILANLSLLFVPAAVGVIQHGRLLGDNFVAISVALVVSAVAALAVSALTFNAIAQWQRRRKAEP